MSRILAKEGKSWELKIATNKRGKLPRNSNQKTRVRKIPARSEVKVRAKRPAVSRSYTDCATVGTAGWFRITAPKLPG